MSIIQVDNISKKYIISHKHIRGGKYNSLVETLNNSLKTIFRFGKSRDNNRIQNKEEFWALKNISFEVNQGDKIGIIGRNGAGKSTLLKILSRITEPTEGKVKIKGRVASLLEVGTGFHPELTGRENIFLNGAILGMKKTEIANKFDEIVSFSEIGKFIDTPVKRYSSGMYVRLAFAVAAHLEPEILLVDEVLAVGDAEFQKKCLGKMEDVSKEGRTVLFVSHNTQAISVLCDKVIRLSHGKVMEIGRAKKVIENYLFSDGIRVSEKIWEYENAPYNNNIKLHSVKVCTPEGKSSHEHKLGKIVTLIMEFWCLKEMNLLPSFHIFTKDGIMVFPTSPLHIKEIALKKYEPGLHKCSCEIPASLLNSTEYTVHVYISRETDGSPYIHIPDVISFKMINDGSAEGEYFIGNTDWPGIIRPLLKWKREIIIKK